MLSKTNSVKSGKYIFQPTKYDEDGNLYCVLYRLNSHHKRVCKVTGIYNFDKEKFELIFIDNNWLTKSHKKILEFLLNEYDWKL